MRLFNLFVVSILLAYYKKCQGVKESFFKIHSSIVLHSAKKSVETKETPRLYNLFLDVALVVCHIDFDGLRDPRLFKKVGDLSDRNLSELMWWATSLIIALSDRYRCQLLKYLYLYN